MKNKMKYKGLLLVLTILFFIFFSFSIFILIKVYSKEESFLNFQSFMVLFIYLCLSFRMNLISISDKQRKFISNEYVIPSLSIAIIFSILIISFMGTIFLGNFYLALFKGLMGGIVVNYVLGLIYLKKYYSEQRE